MSEYQAFYEMVKKWTVKDYQTPGFKAEVLIDTLVSEFIEDIAADYLHIEEDGVVKLLAKEFPIKTSTTETNKNKRNAKVDYLVMANDVFYLVEFKTSNQSLDEEQKKRMRNVVKEKSPAMWKLFFDILDDKSKCKNPRKTKEQSKKERKDNPTLVYFAGRQAREQPDSKKYFFAFEEMKRNLTTKAELINTFETKYYPIKILYLCLCKTRLWDKFFAEAEKAECVFLSTFNPPAYSKNKIQWEQTKHILELLFPLAMNFEKPSDDE